MNDKDKSIAQRIWPHKMPLFQDDFAHVRLAERQRAALASLGAKALNHDRTKK